MKKTEAFAALDQCTIGIRRMIETAGGDDTVALALCATVIPNAGDEARVACGTGGADTTIIAFVISRLIKDALTQIPPEKHKEFRDLLHKMEGCAEIKKITLPYTPGQEKCPNSTLH